jgi:hypothetical protein
MLDNRQPVGLIENAYFQPSRLDWIAFFLSFFLSLPEIVAIVRALPSSECKAVKPRIRPQEQAAKVVEFAMFVSRECVLLHDVRQLIN